MGPEASLAFSLQALFERHEAYAADAERERTRLEQEVERLEGVNQQLQDNNTQLKKENKHLLCKLAEVKHDGAPTHNDSNSLPTIRRLEDQVEELGKKQASLQAALNKALDQERIVVKDWMDTKIEVDYLRKQLRTGRRISEDVPSRSSSQSSIDNAYLSSRNTSTSTSTTLDDNLQSTLSKQHNVLHLFQSQVDDLRNQLLTEQNLALIKQQPTVSSPSQELTFDLSSKQTQEVHVHHHYHTESSTLPPRPQTLYRSKTQAVPTKKRPMLSIDRSMSTRLSKRSSLQAIPDDPMLEQAAAIQSALVLPAFSRGFRSRQSSNNSTPRPQRSASGYSYKTSHASSPQSVQSMISGESWKIEEDDHSRPTTPDSSIVWTPNLCDEDAEDVTTLGSKADSPVMLPYNVSEEGEYFPAEATPVIFSAPKFNQKQPMTSNKPFAPPSSNVDPRQFPQRELPTSLQVPRQRPLRSAASLALLRPSTTTSDRPQPPRRLQSLPSTQSAPSLLTPSTSLTITTVNATSSNPPSSISPLPETTNNTPAKPNTSTSKIGGWLPKWHRNGSGGNQDFAAKSKLQAILHDDVTKHAQPQPCTTVSNSSRDSSMLRDVNITSTATKLNAPQKPQHPPPPPPRAAGVNQPGGLALFLQQAREHELHSRKQTQTQTQARSISAPSFFPSIIETSSPTRSIRSTRLEDSDVDEDALAECLAEVRSLKSLSHTSLSLADELYDDDVGYEEEEVISTDLTFFPRVQGEDWASFDSVSRSPSPPPTSFATDHVLAAATPVAKVATNKKGLDNAAKNQHQHVVVVRSRSLKRSGWRSVSGGGVMGR